MPVNFSQLPGRYERHFKRKHKNPLFGAASFDQYSDEELLEQQRLDHEELMSFLQDLRTCVQQAASLKPNVDSQVLLDLKVQLDKHYETASGLADLQGANKQAIADLTKIIMAQIKHSAQGDALAAQELAQEEQARQLHYNLLEHSIIAELLHADSLIEQDELAATLLSLESTELEAVIGLFDSTQRQAIAQDAQQLLAQLPETAVIYSQAAQNLQQLQTSVNA